MKKIKINETAFAAIISAIVVFTLIFIFTNQKGFSLNTINTTTTSTTTTTTVNGYTIKFVHKFLEKNNPNAVAVKIFILKNNKLIFQDNEDQGFGGFSADGLKGWIKNAKELKKYAIKDITGNGIPELILQKYSGGFHCCSQNYIIELTNPISILLNLNTGNFAIFFKDLNGDNIKEIETSENVFLYWNEAYPDSARPKVILSLQNGKYKADPVLMRKPAPSFSEIKKIADNVKSWSSVPEAQTNVPWKYAIKLIYEGNINSARKYIDLAWRADATRTFKTKKIFWKDLKIQIKKSPYYNDLSSYFGL